MLILRSRGTADHRIVTLPVLVTPAGCSLAEAQAEQTPVGVVPLLRPTDSFLAPISHLCPPTPCEQFLKQLA